MTGEQRRMLEEARLRLDAIEVLAADSVCRQVIDPADAAWGIASLARRAGLFLRAVRFDEGGTHRAA